MSDTQPDNPAPDSKEPEGKRCPLRKLWNRLKPKKKASDEGDVS